MDELFNKSEKYKPVLIILLSLGIIITGFIKGVLLWGFKLELLGWVFITICSALFLVIFSLIFDKVMLWWAKITDWFIPDLRKYPYLRMFLIVPNVIIGFYIVYYLFVPIDFDFTFKILIAIYVVFISPAVITSLIRDDLKKENTVLAEKVSRDMRIKDPLAAVRDAYAHLESHLKDRINADQSLFGNQLIKIAYSGEIKNKKGGKVEKKEITEREKEIIQSKLIYKIGNDDHSTHLYSLLSGAYSLFRNPNQHNDYKITEERSEALISLAELLIELINESEDRMIGMESE